MAFIGLFELFNLLILTLAIGYIFSGYVRPPEVRGYSRKITFAWNDFTFAMLVAAPGVVLHELAHKFVAILFGLGAVFHVWYPGLGIAIFLKLINSPFLLIAPGYVQISDTAILGPFLNNLISVLVSFAGPAINLLMWFLARFILNRARNLTRSQASALYLTQKINMLLFVFNMIPIPPLDGSKVLFGLFKLLFSA